MIGFKSLRQALLLGVAAFGGTIAVSAMDAPAYAQEVTRTYNIQPQDLNSALREFAIQTGRDVLYPPEIVAGKRSPGVQGALKERQALEALLAGTGLRFTQTASNGYAVRDPASPTQLGAADASAPDEEEVLVVTGTNIRGAPPVGSNPLAFTQDDVRESGALTVQSFLQTIPQNFGASFAEIQGGPANFSRGTTPNLRGLGNGTTLVLINGQRQPSSGANGDFVDISPIATSAIERVEVLTDGASAVYGADAIGGVVNIILRRDFEGAESSVSYGTARGDAPELQVAQLLGTRWTGGSVLAGFQHFERDPLLRGDREFAATNDKRPFGGSDFRTNFSNPGNILGPTFQPAFAIPFGQDGTNLVPGDLIPGLVNRREGTELSNLIGESTAESAFVVLTQELSERLELSADVRISRREFDDTFAAPIATLVVPSTNPFYVNPSGGSGPVFVNYNFAFDLGPGRSSGEVNALSGGASARYRISDNWRLLVAGSYGEEQTEARISGAIVDFFALSAALADPDPATAFNPFADGSNTNPQTLASLVSVQDEDYASSLWTFDAKIDGTLFELEGQPVRAAFGGHFRSENLEQRSNGPELGREVTAAFFEFVVPLFSRSGTAPLVEIGVAGRYDQYSDFGETLNPRIGLSIHPSETFTIRGTWGTSFRPPNLSDLNAAQTVFIFPLADPLAPGGQSTALIRFGGNPNLQEERSSNWSAGFDLRHNWLGGRTQLGATYYDIDYSDRVVAPPFTTVLLDASWASVVNRMPSAAELSALCPQSTFGDCVSTPPDLIADLRSVNVSALRTRGIDLTLSHSLSLWGGQLVGSVNANYVLDYEQTVTPDAPSVQLVDTFSNPIDLKLRATVNWSDEALTVYGAINYADDYRGGLGVQQDRIDSLLTVDLGLSYLFQNIGPGGGVEIGVRAINVFDEDPPFANVGLGFDFANANPLGRRLGIDARVRW